MALLSLSAFRAGAAPTLARPIVEGHCEGTASAEEYTAPGFCLLDVRAMVGHRGLRSCWPASSGSRATASHSGWPDCRTESAQQQAQLERAREVVSTLTSTDAMRVTLVAAQAPPQPQGKAIYVRDRSSLIFLASNMPALPPQKIYELWLIPTNGAPIPAGVFKPDARGSATVIEPPLPAGVEAKAFAITVEPEQGSSTPTMPIVMMGAGE